MTKRFIGFILALLLCVSLTVGVSAVYRDETLPRLIDDAQLLESDEEAVLLDKLDTISTDFDFDVIVATVNTLEGYSVQAYADDLYDYNDFGFGAQKDGILLLISMEDRDVYISTTGYGIDAFPDGEWDRILDDIIPELSNADYYYAIDKYATLCSERLDFVKNGVPYDDSEDYYYDDYDSDYYYDFDYDYNNNYQPDTGLDIKWIPLSIFIGMLISLLIMLGFRSKLKTVRSKPTAHDYQIPGSMHVTHQSDLFLYSHVTSTPIQTQNNNNRSRGGSIGGGGVHVGSSGRSHGGGGGKF